MKIHLLMGASALSLGACAYESTPLPDVGVPETITSPAHVSPVRHADPLAGYTYRGPTGPRDWRSVNQEQSESN